MKPLFSLPASLPGISISEETRRQETPAPEKIALAERDTLKTPQPQPPQPWRSRRDTPSPFPAQGNSPRSGAVLPVQLAPGTSVGGQRDVSAQRNVPSSASGLIGMPGFPSPVAQTGSLAGSFAPSLSAGQNKQPEARKTWASEPDSHGRVRQKKPRKHRAARISLLLIGCLGLLCLGSGGYLTYQQSLRPTPTPTPRATQMAAVPPGEAVTVVAAPPPTVTPTPKPTVMAITALSPVPATISGLSYLIMVSLSQQKMTAYDHGQPVLTTLVTTGKPALYTPPGTYYITQRVVDSYFTSPWPKGSPNYYPPMYVYYGLRLNSTQIYIHDATWRSVFGPSVAPDQRSHGCVETPLGAMKWIYNWAPLGMTVVVVQ